MNSTINYLLETNAGLILFMMIYWLVLRNENQFSFKRGYLILSIIGSCLFPLFHFTINATAQTIPTIANIIPSNWLPEIVINGDQLQSAQKTEFGITIWAVIEKLYLVISILLSILFVYRILSIVRLFISSSTYRWNNCLVVESENEQSTFSFFNFIFIGQVNKISKTEMEEILKHEQIHAQQLHSLDVLLVNVVAIICWFNPIVHLYKKTLVQLHEFEADARSVADKDVDQYCGLLAKVALLSVHYPIANHFNKSITLKRIEMMKTMKHKIKLWKLFTIAAVVPLFFYLVACQDQVTTMKGISENSSVAMNIPKEVQDQVDNLKKKNPKNTYLILETYEKGQNQIQELTKKGYNMDELAGFELVNSGSRTFVIIAKNEESIKFSEAVKSGDVYTFVEEMATPKIGMEAYQKYIRDNLKYPQRAKDAKIEGKAFIKFIVNLDGSLSDFVVMKSLVDECDQEAIRVLKGSGEWNPGRQNGKTVRVAFIMPFNFQLNNSAPVAGKLESVQEKMNVTLAKYMENGKPTISGKVNKFKDGSPLAGANLVIKNGTEGTNTNSDGQFTFRPSQEHGILVVSFVGFETQEVSF